MAVDSERSGPRDSDAILTSVVIRYFPWQYDQYDDAGRDGVAFGIWSMRGGFDSDDETPPVRSGGMSLARPRARLRRIAVHT